MSVRVAADRAEEARALFVALCPEGFEERDLADAVELAAYVGGEREERLRAAFGSLVLEDVPPGWTDAWRAYHRPIRVGRLWVGPPWLRADPGSLPVVIDPGQAFGTGAHPTTRLCLELLVEQEPCALLDIGCGSGVLAIAAARLGFDPVLAVDCDPAAVAATRSNAVGNGVRLDVRLGDALVDAFPSAELAVANLELGLIPALARRAPARLLISSGYLASELPELPGWERLERRELDGWTAELSRVTGR